MALIGRRLERALERAGHVDSIRIDIRPGRRFIWRLYSRGREIFAAKSGCECVAGMLLSTEVLINTEFGIERQRLCLPDLN